jgi:hypothetical protein
MKTRIRIFPSALLVISLLLTATVQRGNAVPTESARSITNTSPQYGDPYADFRNVRYSNAGLLNEREEIKLGAQLHREVTKKYNLTDAVWPGRTPRPKLRARRSALEPGLQVSRDPEP